MTVQELQRELAKCDPTAEVWVLTEKEFQEGVDNSEGANCILDRVHLVDDDNPDAMESARTRGFKFHTFPVLIVEPNEAKMFPAKFMPSAKLHSAIKMRLSKGHYEGCVYTVSAGEGDCDCGHQALVDALKGA